MKILIIGNGWLGSRCHEEWSDSVISDTSINSKEDVLALLKTHQPDAVLNAAGVVGKPNVDWCETHQLETIKGNTILPVIIAEACKEMNLYLLHMGTGCIFYGDAPHGGPWKETDAANPVAVYSRAKYAADLVLSTLENVGIARIRMPIDDRKHRANMIDKLVAYPQVVDVNNSATVVPDMILAFRQLLEKKATGIFHCTNPGAITHREILALYSKYVEPIAEKEWISPEALVDTGLVCKKRSNNIMQSINLAKFGISMRPIKEAVEEAMRNYKK